MKKIRLYFFILLFMNFYNSYTQNGLYDFGFKYDFSTKVLNLNNDTLDFAWMGGLNAVHFGELDINLDGINDILVFDRIGNKMFPLINLNIPNQFSYRYEPEYRRFFPNDIIDWVIFYDYNNDGKKDIFTYFPGGIRLFKNASTITELKFELVTNMINSLHFSSYINIFLTNVDLPIITDVDGDGDVDIVVFFVLGNYIELHQNMGVELYSNPDTLDFRRTQRCFGNVMESSVSNQLFLNITCPFPNKINTDLLKNEKNINHVGSTLLYIDTDGNGLKDLLVGDTGYPTITWLKNGGSVDSAHFVLQDTLFPNHPKPIKLYSMPILSYIDVNNDSIKDLIASPFDASHLVSESKKSIWLYKNNGKNDSLNLSFIKENFIQDRMIEHGTGAYPVFFDFNNNGLKDLFVANYGSRDTSFYENGVLKSNFISTVALYENIGNLNNPKFKLITEDFANLSQYKLLSIYPTFGDIDGDEKADMLIGNSNGKIWFFKNTATTSQSMNLVLIDSNFQNIDVGDYSAPFLFDLNKNTKLDLIIGERFGKLFHYENVGTLTAPSYNLVNPNLGDVNTADTNYSWFGHSIPYFYRNNSGKTWLFTGSNRGWVLNYRNIDNNLNGTFELIDTLFLTYNMNKFNIMEGNFSAPAIADLNNDNFPEMVLGNLGGGLVFFLGTEAPADTVGIANYVINDLNLNIFPNPANEILNIKVTPNVTNAKIKIFNILGVLVFEQDYDNLNFISINISNLQKGVYFLNFQTIKNNQPLIINRKIVVQ